MSATPASGFHASDGSYAPAYHILGGRWREPPPPMIPYPNMVRAGFLSVGRGMWVS
jgi:hypothetical protein